MFSSERDVEVAKLHYDYIVIGSGFGSLFFLHGLLQRSKRSRKILILERGTALSHAEQLKLNTNSTLTPHDQIKVPKGHKPWNFTTGLGGGTLCWWGQTPRMHPSDFKTYSKYNVGRDWPLSYDDLEPYYCDAEEIIGVSGDSSRVGPFWRSRGYPMPAQLPSSIDKSMRERYPEQIPLPNARVSIRGGRRPQCCSIGDCWRCPIDSKFTALNTFNTILNHPTVSIILDAEVKALNVTMGSVESVIFTQGGKQYTAKGEVVVLGANSIFNVAILSRSGITHSLLGKGINEQVRYNLEAHFASLSGLDGGTSATGMYCGFLDGDHRRTVGSSAIFFDNRWKFFGLRKEFYSLANKILLVINAEDAPQPENYIEAPQRWEEKPIVHHARHSNYGEAGARYAIERVPALLAPLDVEWVSEPELMRTQSHIQGTTPMGEDPEHSIVDKNLLHHAYRNLLVVGTSVFPTCPVANPSLTAAALSLRAAKNLLS